MTGKATGKAKGGVARAKALSPQERSEIAQKASKARWAIPVLKVTHGSPDHPLKIGDIEIPCYVLEDGTRVLSQRGLQSGIGMSTSGGSKVGEQRVAGFLTAIGAKASENSELSLRIQELANRMRSPIKFSLPSGGLAAHGYEATILADICDAVLAARKSGHLVQQQSHIADQCEILVRGFARVGIIALVDEATGYQRERAKDALAKILEAFVAKELRPWVKTFPSEFYEQLFRLRKLAYPGDTVQRPAYFGHLTNDIVYSRLAPGVLEELKRVTERDEKGRHKTKLHQKLTENIGFPKLREHLASAITIMKLSNDYSDFKSKLDRVHPVYGQTFQLELGEYDESKDTGEGI